MSRRDIDDETSNLALPAGLELCGQDLNMPVPKESGLGIELVEAPLDERIEVLPKQRPIFSLG
jgi:hypothetical protein